MVCFRHRQSWASCRPTRRRPLARDRGDQRSAIVGVSYWRHVRAGSTYRVDLERRGARVSVDLRLPLGPGRPFDIVFGLYALVFFACSAALGLLRPGDRQVRLVASCLMALGIATLTATLATFRGFLAGWEVSAYFVLVTLAPCVYPLTYHVFCRFPRASIPAGCGSRCSGCCTGCSYSCSGRPGSCTTSALTSAGVLRSSLSIIHRCT